MNFLVENLAKMLLKPQYSKPNSIPLNLEIDEGYLRDIVEELSFERVYRTPANVKARDIIVREFTKIFDCQPMLGDPPFDNIIFGNPNHATKLVGAHYDSVPGSPGADDNASAVAVMLAVAKHSRSEGICFVAFNSEEYGLAGSKAFVDNWKPNQLRQAHILNFRNPNYHGAGDTPDTLDYGFMAQVAKILTQIVKSNK